MKVVLQYPHHHYFHKYETCDYFCPHCGTKSVWCEDGEGDFYHGEQYVCTSCNSTFSLPGGCSPTNESAYLILIKQLRLGKTFKPKTRKGN